MLSTLNNMEIASEICNTNAQIIIYNWFVLTIDTMVIYTVYLFVELIKKKNFVTIIL